MDASPAETLLMAFGSGSMLPLGEGSRVRFVGRSFPVYGTYEFDGDCSNPLVFLIRKRALVYLAGSGKVYKDRKLIADFKDSRAAEPSPTQK